MEVAFDPDGRPEGRLINGAHRLAAGWGPGGGGSSSMRVEIIEITPEMAQAWLDGPSLIPWPANRGTVAKYARAMREGRWVEPGFDAIAFDSEHRRINGTHRLAAIVSSGVTLKWLVAFDAPTELLAVGDGQRRRLAYQFTTGTYRKERVAVARLLLWYDAGAVVRPAGTALQFDNDVLLGAVNGELHDLILRSAKDASAASQISRLPVAAHAAVLAIARRDGADPFRIEHWLIGLRDGVGLERDDPRQHLIRRMTSTHAQVLRRDTAAVWMLTVRAFNTWLASRPMKVLKYDVDDAPPRIVIP